MTTPAPLPLFAGKRLLLFFAWVGMGTTLLST